MTEADIYDYKSSALTAIKFKLVFTEKDLGASNEKCTFGPEMAHQIFGESESIFGYSNLSIDLYYLHNSSKCFLDIKYSKKVDTLEPDDIVDLINPWLPTGYISNADEFNKIVQNEKHDQIFGTVLHQFERKSEVISLPGEEVTCQYKITQCDPQDPLFQDYHQRFENFIIWFIDAANFIDLSDERWLIFYVYEEFKHPRTDEIIITPIGYTAIYKFFFYPANNRARISQFFILPTHQRKGIGSQLYKTVYNRLVQDMKDVVDITVEEPSKSFQCLRDICDACHILKDLKETNSSLTTKSQKNLYNYMGKHKICKRQASRLQDILQYYTALKSGNGQVKSFQDALFKRIETQLEKDKTGTHKKARGITTDQDSQLLLNQNLQARYSNYLAEIEPVAKKLSGLLV